MPDLTRRSFLKAASLLPLAGLGAGVATRVLAADAGRSNQATFTVDLAQAGRQVASTLSGLSFETRQLGAKGYFSPDNTALIDLLRELNPQGILRLGGNTSDYAVWSGYRGTLPVQKTRRGSPRHTFVITPAQLRDLAGFVRATGWKLVFGVNLKIGVPAMAAELSAAVKQALGEDLLAVQIGNEANNYESDYAAFDAAWKPYARAIDAVGVPIGGPDTGANTDWVIAYAEEHARQNVLLSRHYYRGPAPKGSLEDMLAGDAAFYREVECLMRAADGVKRPFHLSEANSYYFGGKDGVSNVFASALWGADFMLALAQRGVAGIQFHGGTLLSVEASLGRAADTHVQGSLAARRDAVTSRYSAIAGDVALGFAPRPLYHGMQLAQRFAGARMLTGTLAAGEVNLTAYAAQRDRQVLLALINKDTKRDVTLRLPGLADYRPTQYQRLTAPALDARHGTVLAQAPGGTQAIDRHGGSYQVPVPRGSAAWLAFDRRGTAR